MVRVLGARNTLSTILTRVGMLLLYIFKVNVMFVLQVENLQDLLDDLDKLQTDGAKFRAKRDRKVQRASFREIYSSVSGEGTIICMKIV